MVSRIEPEKPDEEIELHAPFDIIESGELKELKPLFEVQFTGVPDAPLQGRGFSISIGQVLGQALMGSTLPGLRLTDTLLDRADCSNATWIDTRIVRARFECCKLTGFDARGAELRDVAFSECKMPDSFLVESTLTRVRFDSCKLNGLDLCGAKIKSVAIHTSDARNLRLQGAKIDTLDLRGSLIDGISLDPGSAAHLIIDPTQGGAIAQALGVRVREIDHR